MLSVDEALKLILDHTAPLQPAPRNLKDALGCILAEPIVSDIDSPPHDKSVVDGYAVIATDVAAAGRELEILEEITAGAMPTRTVEPGTATCIMTGAPIPAGADAVVMFERTEMAGERVRILQSPVKAGQNITRRAASLARGDAVLQAGKVLRAIELGLLAEVGRSVVSVVPPPRVAVLATGNELVRADQLPGPGQIRNSNEELICGLVSQVSGLSCPLGIARDDQNELQLKVQEGLDCQMLIISGGVSAGVLDLVPKTLEQLGVVQVFHKVNLKPGKPLWFGVRQPSNEKQTLVFGLPGNPVSSLVCFELFVRPAIQKLRGLPPTGLRRVPGQLLRDHQQRGERPTYWPASICEGDVMPLAWKGSGDLRTLTDANCLAFFPEGDRLFRTGEQVEVLLMDDSIAAN